MWRGKRQTSLCWESTTQIRCCYKHRGTRRDYYRFVKDQLWSFLPAAAWPAKGEQLQEKWFKFVIPCAVLSRQKFLTQNWTEIIMSLFVALILGLICYRMTAGLHCVCNLLYTLCGWLGLITDRFWPGICSDSDLYDYQQFREDILWMSVVDPPKSITKNIVWPVVCSVGSVQNTGYMYS